MNIITYLYDKERNLVPALVHDCFHYLSWGKVGDVAEPGEGKARYKAMAQADKDRYVGELEAHNYRWKNLRPCVTLTARTSNGMNSNMQAAAAATAGFRLCCLMWPLLLKRTISLVASSKLSSSWGQQVLAYPSTTLSGAYGSFEQRCPASITTARAIRTQCTTASLKEQNGCSWNVSVLQVSGIGSATASTVTSTAGGSAGFQAAACSCSAASPGATWRIPAGAAASNNRQALGCTHLLPFTCQTCHINATSAHSPPTAAIAMHASMSQLAQGRLICQHKMSHWGLALATSIMMRERLPSLVPYWQLFWRLMLR